MKSGIRTGHEVWSMKSFSEIEAGLWELDKGQISIYEHFANYLTMISGPSMHTNKQWNSHGLTL